MKLTQHTNELKNLFIYDNEVKPKNLPLEIRPYRFMQKKGTDEIRSIRQTIPPSEFCLSTDDNIEENKNFNYTIFVPPGTKQTDKAIILLHGLNERSWEKYLPWAEYLTEKTGKAVILFPIAFHMNRTPESWYNPRAIQPWVSDRKNKIENPENSTFVNVALSSRLSESPLRFYVSGRESVYDLWQLMSEIKNGQHSLFKDNTSIDIFAYSIGAFLAQVLLLADPEELTSDTKLFMFCGGSLFSRMDGNARDIMDRDAFQKLRNFLMKDFIDKENKTTASLSGVKDDFLTKAFKAMISSVEYSDYREAFFKKAKDRIKAVTLKMDTVIPTIGVKEAFGKLCEHMTEELDFPYEYSHQNPFPKNNRVAPEVVRQSFCGIFDRAAAFLA